MNIVKWLNNYFLAEDGEEITISDYTWFYGVFCVTTVVALIFITAFSLTHIKNLQAIGLQVG